MRYTIDSFLDALQDRMEELSLEDSIVDASSTFSIQSSERIKLMREREQYVSDFNKKKSEYNEQVNKFQSDYDNYVYKVAEQLHTILKSNLDKLPGAEITVQQDSWTRYDNKYFIKISYSSPKRTNYVRLRDSKARGYLRGFSWDFYIYLTVSRTVDPNTGDEAFDVTLQKNPQIISEVLESNDFPVLQATYELFNKIDTIDWHRLLNRINAEVPKKSDYVTVEDPGDLNTGEWDAKISNYDISRIIGEDLWIKVNIDREQSYDRYNSYCNARGVDGVGWVKVLSESAKFYVFYWLDARNASRQGDYTAYAIERAERVKYKLKKIYFNVVRPVEYSTTEELTQDDISNT